MQVIAIGAGQLATGGTRWSMEGGSLRDGTSRISREAYVRFWARLGVKFRGSTRQTASNSSFHIRARRSIPGRPRRSWAHATSWREASGEAAVTRADLREGDHVGRGRSRAAENDDCGRHYGWPVADHVERRHRLGSDAAHRGANDRRNDLVHHPDPCRDPSSLWCDQRMEIVGGAAASNPRPRR